MLSVTEAAQTMGISPARVRALISSGLLPAQKIGRNWAVREEDVIQRLSQHVKPGRPCSKAPRNAADKAIDPADGSQTESLRNLYKSCKEAFRYSPDPHLIMAAESSEEASFYMAMADFFLKQKQRDLVKRGVY